MVKIVVVAAEFLERRSVILSDPCHNRRHELNPAVLRKEIKQQQDHVRAPGSELLQLQECTALAPVPYCKQRRTEICQPLF
jgi:hypothetical protein